MASTNSSTQRDGVVGMILVRGDVSTGSNQTILVSVENMNCDQSVFFFAVFGRLVFATMSSVRFNPHQRCKEGGPQ
jgi:hypothetical protein